MRVFWHLIASFVVAVMAFWFPVDLPSIVLATAGLTLEFFNRKGGSMGNKCLTVGQGISGR